MARQNVVTNLVRDCEVFSALLKDPAPDGDRSERNAFGSNERSVEVEPK
jgi:hypothetical protein